MNDRPYCVTGAFLDESAHEGELLVDGARYRVTEADYRSLGFAEGDFLDESALEAVCTAAERLRCIRKAMDCLSYGDMSGKKLLGKLTGRFDRELASSVVELLRARGYLDDAALSARAGRIVFMIISCGDRCAYAASFPHAASRRRTSPRRLSRWRRATIRKIYARWPKGSSAVCPLTITRRRAKRSLISTAAATSRRTLPIQ